MASGLEGRNQEIYRRRVVYGWTQERIAQHFKIDQSRVSQIISEMEARGLPDTAAMAREAYEQLQEVMRRQMELTEMLGAPVTSGKDGAVVYDPDTGEVVRDYALRRSTLADVVRTTDAIAKRFGLNAPEKIQTQATVKYEIGGLDSEDLT